MPVQGCFYVTMKGKGCFYVKMKWSIPTWSG